MDPDRVRDLYIPSNREQLESVLGMFNYVRSFVPNYRKMTKILTDLMKKDVVWNLTNKHTEVMNELK